jgi:phosphoribosylformylglycinamidine cyclo-ligase
MTMAKEAESKKMTTPKTYAQAGVDVEKADRFVQRLKSSAARPEHDKLWKVPSGYAAIYPTSKDSAVACTTDGVGTKLLVAMAMGKFDTIGIDLVAMCANDLICVGATPGAFLDYFATGRVEELRADEIIKGIIQGCDQAGMILAGGETAEMPDLYQGDHFDLAGFAIGTVTRASLIDGLAVKPGDAVVAVASSGIHANGLSLARKLIGQESKFYQDLLVPTRIYCRPAAQIFAGHPGLVKGMAHITGGGWTNIGRINKNLGYQIDAPLPVPKIFSALYEEVGDAAEMYHTFNMGMGLVLVCDGDGVSEITSVFQACGFEAARVGSVQEGFKGIKVREGVSSRSSTLDLAFSKKT